MLGDVVDRRIVSDEVIGRERGAALGKEYTGLAGVDRGRRRIWSGHHHIWYDTAHIIDLGRRPDTARKPRPAATPDQSGLFSPSVGGLVGRLLAWFADNDNRPATAKEMAAAAGCSAPHMSKVLRAEGADLFCKVGFSVRSNGGPSAALYAAVDTDADIEGRIRPRGQRASELPVATTPTDLVVEWFTANDNRPATIEDAAAALGMTHGCVKSVLYRDDRFCVVGQVRTNARPRNQWQLKANPTGETK